MIIVNPHHCFDSPAREETEAWRFEEVLARIGPDATKWSPIVVKRHPTHPVWWYIVDGHHRAEIARRLNVAAIAAEEVK